MDDGDGPNGSHNKLAESISARLGLYARMASAAGVSLLALAQPSEAEVVYTQVHKAIGANVTVPVDFNHDGIVDLVISENSSTERNGFEGIVLEAIPRHGGGVLMGSFIGFAADLPDGARIGDGRTFYHKPALMIGYGASFYGTYFGSWAYGPTDRCLGVKFLIDGQVHYGWARVAADLRFPDIVAVLKGFAYETEPGRPIRAGYRGPASESETEPEPSGEILPAPQMNKKPAPPSLGLLALGALGLPIWRPE